MGNPLIELKAGTRWAKKNVVALVRWCRLTCGEKKEKDSFKRGKKNQLKGKQSTFLAISESECAFFRDFLAKKMFHQHTRAR